MLITEVNKWMLFFTSVRWHEKVVNEQQWKLSVTHFALKNF